MMRRGLETEVLRLKEGDRGVLGVTRMGLRKHV